MVNATEIERVLRTKLAPTLQTGIPRLALVLMDIINGTEAPQSLERTLTLDPNLVPLFQALAGQTIALGGVSLMVGAAPELERTVGMPAQSSPQLQVVHTEGHEQIGDDVEDHKLVAVSGAVVFGPVVGKNIGTITYTNIAVQLLTGTRLNPGAAPTIERRAISHPPLPTRTFYDREQPLSALQLELLPRHGAWLTGSLGCGLTTLLKQAANLPNMPAFADGVLYVDGAGEPTEIEDVSQRLYSRFYRSQSGDAIRLEPAAAEAELGNLNALFLLDRLRLPGNELASLANTLAGSGSVLVAAEGLAPDTLLDLSLEGLPPADALRLCAAEARVDATDPDQAALLQRLCAALEFLPLPMLLAARLIRMKVVPLAQLIAVAEEMRTEQMPLARAARLTLTALSAEERAVLAALVRVGGPDAELAALIGTSQLSQATVEDALARMMALRLVNIEGGRFMVAMTSLRQVLARLLPRDAERRNAALFFVGATAAHGSSMAWLGHEWINLIAGAKTLLREGQGAASGELARAVQPYLVLNGMWGSWQRVIDLAEQAAQMSGDTALLGWALHERGTRAGLLGDLNGASVNLAEARRLRIELGDQAGADATLHNMEYLGLLPPPALPDPKAPSGSALLGIPIWIIVLFALLLAGGIAAAVAMLPVQPIANMTAQPMSGVYPLTVFFDASASSANSRGVLTYLWDFGDGATLTTTDGWVTHLYAAPDVYNATLRVQGGDTLSKATGLTINVINTSPQPTIEVPASTTRLTAGQALTLRGRAIDREDGRLADQALRWTLVLRQGEHAAAVLARRTGNNIQLSVPAPEDIAVMTSSSLEIGLTATDSQGQTGVITEVLRPDMVQAAFVTEPPGLQIRVNGRAIITPHTLDLWRSYALQVDAPEQVDAAGRSLAFERWSDGGAATHTISATSATSTYTATFTPLLVAFGSSTFTASEDDGAAEIAVRLSSSSAHTITVAYATGSGSATAGSDYTAITDTLTFAPGETSKSFTIELADDALDEPDETIALSLSIAGHDIASPQSEATLTLLDDDPPPAITVRDQPLNVPEQAGNLAIVVALDQPSAQAVTVAYATSDGSATAGQDYTPASGTLTFAPGQTSQTVSVPIADDQLSEAAETIGLTLSNPSNATLSENAATITIADNDEQPTFVIGSPQITQSEDSGSAAVAVLLSAVSGQPVTVAYATGDGSATAGQDYTPISGTLTFAPGETSQTISVPIADDPSDEEDEQFQLTIDRPDAANLGAPASAAITIQDNDPAPVAQFSQADYSINENAGAGAIGVVLNTASGKTVTVIYGIFASNRAGFPSRSSQTPLLITGTLTFEHGQISKDINLPITDDPIDEPNRTARLALGNPSNASLGAQSTATLTIVDDDMPVIEFSPPAAQVKEGTPSSLLVLPPNEVAMTVVLSAPSWQPITVDYATSDGSALDKRDYLATQGTLTFNPGETSKSFLVRIARDSIDEVDETFTANLSNPTNSVLAPAAAAVATIIDDDDPPTATFAIASPTVSESAGSIDIIVNLSAPSEQVVTIGYTTADGSTVAGQDYASTTGTLVFQPGETSKTFMVQIVDDSSSEVAETFSVTFLNPENASKGQDAQITILDDDGVRIP